MKRKLKKSKEGKKKIIGLLLVIVFVAAIVYFFLPTKNIPFYVGREKRMIYEWASTQEGATLLEKLPCYCGCKFEGHKHTRHCFWKDDGTFDRHGITCSVCLDIAKKGKEMHEQGMDICTIRKEIDRFYEPNKELGTETPMPPGC